MSRVLFIAPHPDDETLGCGGTIFKHKGMGNEIHWVIMTNILIEEGYDEEKINERQEVIDEVAAEYGFKEVFKLELPTCKLDIIPKKQMVDAMNSIFDKVKPETIYLPYRNDVHSDHKVTFDVVISSTKTFRCPFIKKVYIYEVISETEFSPPLFNNIFSPNSFSDVTNYMDKKLSVIKKYKTEIGEHPFPRSIDNIKALAVLRGATAGVKHAESFMILKDIW